MTKFSNSGHLLNYPLTYRSFYFVQSKVILKYRTSVSKSHCFLHYPLELYIETLNILKNIHSLFTFLSFSIFSFFYLFLPLLHHNLLKLWLVLKMTTDSSMKSYVWSVFLLFAIFTIIDQLFIYSFKKQQNRQDYNANAKRKNSFGKSENPMFLNLFDVFFC